MARYLERLVARVGVPAEAPASPAQRSQYEHQPGDPFEETALWNPVAAASPSPVPAVVPSRLDAGPAAPPAQLPGVPVVQAGHEESRPDTPRPETSRILPPETREVVPSKIELLPQPDVFEPPAQPELVRSETVIERETVREKVSSPIPPAESGAPLNLPDVERDVLAKLMPALDAWFASNTAAPPAAPVVPPSITPQRPEPERTAPVQTPQLVIGSISVEVVSPPTPVRVPASRPRTLQDPSRQTDPFPSRLGFGLGQM
jgi:hypothetical protein